MAVRIIRVCAGGNLRTIVVAVAITIWIAAIGAAVTILVGRCVIGVVRISTNSRLFTIIDAVIIGIVAAVVVCVVELIGHTIVVAVGDRGFKDVRHTVGVRVQHAFGAIINAIAIGIGQ